MPAVDLTGYIGRGKNRIYRVGIELEGMWTKAPVGVELIRDGSLHFSNNPTGAKVGELPSDQMEIIKIRPWMTKYYPQMVNDSCGLHVHMSFRKAWHYAQLMTRDYQDTVIAYLDKWGKAQGLPSTHPLWNRLLGRNTYCKLDYYADTQVLQKKKDYNHDIVGSRYTAINYCHGLHETVECRVLPMMETASQGIDAVRTVIAVTNAFLAKTAKKEKTESLVVNDTAERTSEITQVIV